MPPDNGEAKEPPRFYHAPCSCRLCVEIKRAHDERRVFPLALGRAWASYCPMPQGCGMPWCMELPF